MRITNKMMTNNMLYNINSNKSSLSSLEEQYSTGLAIQRPSDDPIVAVRALKLRTNLSELNQYYEKDFYLSRTSFSEILKDTPDDKLVKWYVFESDRYLNEFANDEDYMNLHV